MDAIRRGVCRTECVQMRPRQSAEMFMNNFHILSINGPDMLIQMLDESHWWGLKNNSEYVGEETEWHRAS